MERLSTFPHDAFRATDEMDLEESPSSSLDTAADLAFQDEPDSTAPLAELGKPEADFYTDQRGTTLQDALHQVPQLLLTCVSNSVVGLRGMRLVCKETAAITSSIKEARRYCIKLSSQPSICEPLQKVAELLRHSRLESLRVEVSIQSGRCGSKVLLFCFWKWSPMSGFTGCQRGDLSWNHVSKCNAKARVKFCEHVLNCVGCHQSHPASWNDETFRTVCHRFSGNFNDNKHKKLFDLAVVAFIYLEQVNPCYVGLRWQTRLMTTWLAVINMHAMTNVSHLAPTIHLVSFIEYTNQTMFVTIRKAMACWTNLNPFQMLIRHDAMWFNILGLKCWWLLNTCAGLTSGSTCNDIHKQTCGVLWKAQHPAVSRHRIPPKKV